MRTLHLISQLEKLPIQSSESLDERRSLVRLLEVLATRYEQAADCLKSGDPMTDSKVEAWGLGIASRIRSYKSWVLFRAEGSRGEIIDALACDLRLTLLNDWHRLETTDPTTPRVTISRKARLAWALAGVILAALALVVVGFSAKLGALGPYLVALAGAGALLALTNAGLSLPRLVEAQQAVQNFGGGK
jgi:hypothetical protein